MSVPLRRGTLHAVAALAACVLSVGSVPRANAQTRRPSAAASGGSFDEIYAKGKAVNDGMKTLTARFTETTTSTLLTKPLIARGQVAVERPARVVLRYTEPDPRTVLIDGNTMTVVWPSRSVRQVTDIGATQRRIQKYFVNGTADDLRHEFQIEDPAPGAGRPNTYSLSLIPKRKQIHEALTRLDLWVDRTSLLLDAMTMTFANGDTKTLAFEDVVKNAPLGPGTFAIER
jgi:outer membrane lipoprotein-sorting protein